MKKGFLIAILIAVVALPIVVGAATCKKADGTTYESGLNLCYPSFPGAPPLTSGIKLEQLVAWLYVFIVGISGFAAFIMIVWGGVKWMSSQGDPGQVGDARDKIKMALLGLLLVLASFLILQIINPELTALRGLSLQGIPKAPPLTLQTTGFTLTANGQESSILIKPNESINLAWNATGFRSCQASSEPIKIWEGAKASSGNEVVVTSAQEGNYTFFLACFAGTTTATKTVEVVVSSEATVVDKTQPTVVLQANGYDGPLTLPSQELKTGNVEFTWVATDAGRCVGEDQLVIPSKKEKDLSGSMPLLLLGLPNGEYRYTVTCTNLQNGKSASDTVIITVNI